MTAHADHIAKLKAVKKPVLAIAELVWNSLDADAAPVDISLHPGKLDVLEAIEVSDNGWAMTPERALESFSGLGGSWKRLSTKSEHENRVIHGKEGCGRFRALGLGRVAEWHVCYPVAKSKLATFKIAIIDDTSDRFDITPDKPVPAQKGETRAFASASQKSTKLFPRSCATAASPSLHRSLPSISASIPPPIRPRRYGFSNRDSLHLTRRMNVVASIRRLIKG